MIVKGEVCSGSILGSSQMRGLVVMFAQVVVLAAIGMTDSVAPPTERKAVSTFVSG